MSTFRLAHLSDPHLAPPESAMRGGGLSKRVLSRFAWRRKRHRHDPAVLDAIAEDLRAAGPDHVAVTGDLTNFATAEEFAAAAVWLESLGHPSAVTVSPGNHDALVARGAPDRFAPWRPWLGDEADDDFPRVRVRGPVAIVNACSAVPTAPHLATGQLGGAQLDRLADVLTETGAKGLFRVLLLHHPIAPGVVSKRKSLDDAPALREILARHGAELVLHGHAHEALLNRVAGPAGPIPTMGVPSASTPAGHHDPAARWNLIEIAPGAAGFQVRIEARGVVPGPAVQPVGAYVLAA
ncbi:metallophosphoesterase family protein [Phenylobacterium sp. VNQ135]|uniref:metallophosphoesterase family protein n=1 Tax=Phenylobacterium sp. VNQ135 TaxID=3400922 RepID=UPI003BFAF279